MEKIIFYLASLFLGFCQILVSQTITIQVDAAAGKIPISPFIFGKNNCLSDDPTKPLSAADWQFLKDAGVKMFRENGGNNATKYNWRLKMTSHPDWYNNVYKHDWDYMAKSLMENIPSAYGIWAFQLIGKSASNTSNNFNDWGYNQSKWWSGVNQNLAGGGVVKASGGSKATTEGNPNLYLENWTADSTVGILDKWFGNDGLGLNKKNISYWSMDNEAEIWSGTHDDVMPSQLSAEEFMQLYFNVAKKARAKFPEIKLMGPVPANEWQWYNWNNNAISYNGANYVWLEFFIRRIADEQKSSGIRLLDVLDIHFYPGTSVSSEIVQLHRVFFDKNYVFPEANGVKRIGGWDANLNKEYIFERCREWLVKYLGANHGVTFSVSEIGIEGNDPNVTATWYASTLGTFANEGVEVFTPWSWKTGMWETLHLFSQYSKTNRIQSISSSEETVSAYSSINNAEDSVSIFLVNRSTTQSKSVNVTLSNFVPENGAYNFYSLKNLPSNETFVSHTSNALKNEMITINNGAFSASLPPLSTTAVLLSKKSLPLAIQEEIINEKPNFNVLVDRQTNSINVSYKIKKSSNVLIKIYDIRGRIIKTVDKGPTPSGNYNLRLSNSDLMAGSYIIRFTAGAFTSQKKFVVIQ